DPELAADLLPRRTTAPEADTREHTTPEPFDAGALALLTEVDPRDSGLVDDGSPDRTTALERHPTPPTTPAAPGASGAGPAAPATEPMRTTVAPAAATTALPAARPSGGPARAPS